MSSLEAGLTFSILETVISLAQERRNDNMRDMSVTWTEAYEMMLSISNMDVQKCDTLI